MPAAVIPLITTIASVAAAGIGATELGLKLSGAGQPSPTEARKAQEAAALKQAQADADQKRKMILAALPGAQEQSGGTLQAPSLTDLAAVIAGLPGETNTGAGHGALASYLGTGVGAGATGTGINASPETMVSSTYGLSGTQG